MTVQSITPDSLKDLPICAPGDFLDEALDTLVQRGHSSVIVLENTNELVGILTDDDIIRAVQSRCESGDSITRDHVFEWMSVDPVTADVDTTLEKALGLMTRHQIRHLIITKNNKPVAMTGVSDILKALHEKEEALMEDLRNKILVPIADVAPELYL